MNNIFKILSVFIFCFLLASCGGDEETATTPIRDYAEQYAADIDSIDDFIDTHYMTVNSTNFDVTFTEIPTGGTQQSIRTQTQYPLKDTLVKEDGIEYKIYFIKFREGDPVNGKRPTQVDSIHIAYRGIRLTNDQFDGATNPVWFGLQDVITGWNHIIPNFKTGTYTTSPGPNPITFNDFGAGVMFLPSGVAYYNTGAGTIPSYAPIIFSFKLYELRYRDHDRDGILSKDERNLTDFSPSNTNVLTRWKEDPFTGYDYDGNGTLEIYDTDGDGVPNMLDIDDDGDGYQTKFEIKNPITGLSFPFANIPTCSGTTGKKKHLDKNCN
jgi:FKBP-type peptidyl-prolyl cis-trans isomerase FkpA